MTFLTRLVQFLQRYGVTPLLMLADSGSLAVGQAKLVSICRIGTALPSGHRCWRRCSRCSRIPGSQQSGRWRALDRGGGN